MELLAEERGSTLLWTLCDHLGSVRDVINTSGTVLNHIEYNAYGKLINKSSTSNTPTFRFTGKMTDDTTELQWNINRWYDANVGRWISEDPIGFEAGDANLVRYVGNNVVKLLDFSGLWEYLNDHGTFSGQLGPVSDAGNVVDESDLKRYGPASSYFSLEFNHDHKKFSDGCCEKIQFIQIYYMSARQFPPIYSLVNEQWTIDAGKETEPYYPNGVGGNPKYPSSKSSMIDAPFFGKLGPCISGHTQSLHLELCAVCSKGSRLGEIYGCMLWGHEFVISGSRWNKKISAYKRHVNNVIWGDCNTYRLNETDGSGNYIILGGATGRKTYKFSKILGLAPSQIMEGFLDKYFP